MRIPRLPRVADLRDSRAARWGVRGLAGGFALLATYSLVVVPMRDWWLQRNAIADKTAEFEALAEANEQLRREVDQLATAEGIRQAARTHLGYVLPGEKRIVLTETPALPVELPLAWPYTMVSQIIDVRADDAAHGGGGLAPLAP